MSTFISNDVAGTQAARLLRRLSKKHPHILFGPILLEPEPGTMSYFVLATVERGQWQIEQIKAEDRDLVEQFRAELGLALISRRRGGIALHDMDDELEMAQLCCAILPTEKIDRVRRLIEAERATSCGELVQ